MSARAASWAMGLVVLVAADAARAQLTISNIVEGQAGNRPFADFFGEPTNPTSVYDELNGELLLSGVRLGFRYEYLDDSRQANSYQRFTQRYAEGKTSGVRVRVGDFYTLFGRGLTLRAFELPGVVLQDPATGSRSSFSRELDGVLVEGERGLFSARALSSSEESFTLSGAQGAVGPWRGAQVGATYVRTSAGGGTNTQERGSGFAQIDPFELAGVTALALPIYAEYAQADGSVSDWWKLRTGDPVAHALYVGSELVWSTLAVSAEWKDYRNFRLGFTDPPSLVREHTYALPNRSTHVLNATSEHGFQVEGSWSVNDWGALIANHSRADGTPSIRALRFEEIYLEAHLMPSRWAWLEWNTFYDRGEDTFVAIDSREIYGTVATVRFLGLWSSTVDLERLDAVRLNLFGPNEGFTDQHVSLQVARSGWGTLAWTWQRTTDPQEEAPDLFGGPVDPRVFNAWSASAQLGPWHTLQLFVGERRGGPACTAGTCYDVPPFDGAELRLTSRF